MKYARKTRQAAVRETNRLAREYEITDPGGEALLRTFASAFSLEIDCQQQIEKDGLCFKDRFEQMKAHPLLTVLTSARAQKMAALKALCLDVEPLQIGLGRPKGS
jgi:phage terminase small subunit